MNVLDIIRSVFPAIDPSLEFDKLPIDSFDLMTLRVTLEQQSGRHISDHEWIRFRSFRDIQKFFEKPGRADGAGARAACALQRQYLLNMPQMAVGGLSENWLFKELGDIHWAMICDALERPSDGILDELDNRLYATFTRIRIELSAHLKGFRENEPLGLTGRLSRFGKSMFFSDVRADGDRVQAKLMSTFARRQAGNTSLLKGEPRLPESCTAEVLPEMPPFGAEYREMRGGRVSTLALAGETFTLATGALFETEYALNPYHDLNGVNLLYFAAYPAIHDVCERQFFHRERRDWLRKDWALDASTLARDVFYYGNCDVDDAIVFRLLSCDALPDGKVKVVSSLYRKSDSMILSHIFTLKERHG